VADTTLEPVFAARKPKPWDSLARGQDYYSEGALVWLEADQVIRSGTGGRKGLDDFARAFFSAHPGERVRTYEFEDVVAALNSVYPYDWAGFLNKRIYQPGAPAPLAGTAAAGYRLVWKDAPNPYDKARADSSRSLNLAHSLGLSIDRDGTVSSVRWQGPAANAGIVGGAKIIAVNSRAYDPDLLRQAIADARGSNAPIELLVKRGDRFQTVPVQWNGGLRWPWLEKTSSAPAPLDLLLAPRRGNGQRPVR
jgi:predicted metalloprotease with PDZ domain